MHQHVFNRKAAAWTGVVLMMVLMAAGCGETDGVEKYGVTIKIAAQRDPGQKVVAEMYRALIEKHTSLKAEVIPDFKSPELLRAFTDNEIQVATLYTARFPENSLMARSLDPARDALLEAQAASLGAPYYRWLKPLGFRNRYALFADGQTARKNGWQSISDLKTEAPRLNAAVEASWLEINSEGFNALCEQYGLAFHRVIPAQTRDVYSAIQNGQADVIVAETDDGEFAKKGFVS